MRRSTPLLLPLLLCLLALAALPAGARADATDNRIAKDCQTSATGALTGDYTKAQLRHAKNNLPGDVLEYSGCYDAIRQALLAPSGGSGPGGGPGGDGGSGDLGSGATGGVGGTSGSGGGSGAPGGDPNAPAPPPHTGTEAPVAIAGTTIEPGDLPSIGQDPNTLPDGLVVLLVLLGLAAVAAAALTIGRRVVARRRA